MGRVAQRPQGLCRGRRRARPLPRSGRHGDPGLQCADPGRRRRAGAGEDRRAPRCLGRHRLLGRHRPRPYRRQGLSAHALGGAERARLCPLRAPAGAAGAARRGRGHRVHGPAQRPHRDCGGLSRPDRGGRGAQRAVRVRQSRPGGGCGRAAPDLRGGDRRRIRAAGRGGVLGRQAAPVRVCHGAGAGGGAARQQAGPGAHPRHRRCGAHRPRLRARARRRRPADRRRHSQRRLARRWASSIPHDLPPCSPSPMRRRPRRR